MISYHLAMALVMIPAFKTLSWFLIFAPLCPTYAGEVRSWKDGFLYGYSTAQPSIKTIYLKPSKININNIYFSELTWDRNAWAIQESLSGKETFYIRENLWNLPK